MDVRETKTMDLFNKVHVFELMKVHIFGPNIRLIRLFSLMLNYANPDSWQMHLLYLYCIHSNQFKLCESLMYFNVTQSWTAFQITEV